MRETLKADICVIGGGAGGLSVAAAAAQMGSDTVLIEKTKMGGDCLHNGCIPSKTLLATGGAARAVRDADNFGISISALEPRSADVYAKLQGVISEIEPNDSVERFEGLGARVVTAAGKFVDRQEVEADGICIKARRIVVATGSGPFIPSIRGLDRISYFTNETIFNLSYLPNHLIIIGGGSSGIELAQAHRFLGCRVTLLEKASIMSKDDMELVDIVRNKMLRDGVGLREAARIDRIEPLCQGVRVIIKKDGGEETIDGSHLLVTAGRKPNIAGLELEKGGVEYSANGIDVDDRLRTSNKKVFAIGDVLGDNQFTHVAGYQAGVVIKNALFRIPAKAEYGRIPRVTFSAPELAQVGITEDTAKKDGMAYRLLRWSFHENDRAITEDRKDGAIKAIVTPKGHILGCGIVGAHAGELIQPWVLAMTNKLKIRTMAEMVVPYPTFGEVSKRAAMSFYTSFLCSKRTRKFVKFLSRFG